MSRLYAIAIALCFVATSAFAQVQPNQQRRAQAQQNLNQQQNQVQQNRQQNRAQQNQIQRNQRQNEIQQNREQLQQRIADFYLSDFRSAVELNEDQFFKLGPTIRQFIRMRFQAARQRQALNQQLNGLLQQPNPSEADVQKLSDERARIESEVGTMEAGFVNRLRSDLSARQLALVLQFNTTFFEQTMPKLLDRAREAAASQQQRPNQNQNSRDPNRQGNAFDEK